MDDITGNRPATQPEVIINMSLEGTSSVILSEEDVGIRENGIIEVSKKEAEEEEGNGEETKAVNV